MIVVRLIWLAVLTLALPMWVGHCFAAVDKSHKNVAFLWISGQMLLWAGFQVICVPVILLEGRFRHVMIGYSVYLLVLLVLATVFWFRNPRGLRPVRQEKTAKSEKAEVLLWDERFSTIAAERSLREVGLNHNQRKSVIDKMAAVHILQGYLDSKAKG